MKNALKLYVLVTSLYSITSPIGLLYEIIQLLCGQWLFEIVAGFTHFITHGSGYCVLDDVDS